MSTTGESKVGHVTYGPRLPMAGEGQETSDRVVFLGDYLFQQGRYQSALSQCTRALLQHASTDSERTEVLNQALAPLLEAAGALRAGIFENYTDEQGQFLSRMIAEATAPDVLLTLGTPGVDRIPWRTDHVAPRLRNGDPVQGLLAEIGTSADVKVFLFLPIHVNQVWWGYIGFGDSGENRVWSENEILLLRTAAEIISNFLNRVQLASALHESEELFRLSFDKSPIGAAMVSLSKRFLRVNQPFCQITGYSETELLARTFPEMTHPDDLESGLRIADRFASGEIDQYQADKRYRQKNGNVIWAHIAVQIVRNVDGKPLYLLQQVEDISERRQLARQAQLQTAIANCSRELLSSPEDISSQLLVLTKVMEHLVQGVRADRATIFRNRHDSAGVFCLDMQAEACAPGVHAQIYTDINHHYPWTRLPDEMRQSLSSNESFGGFVEDLFSTTPKMRDALLSQPLLSVLFCPIHFGDEWWGFIGFDDCHEKRVWDEQEVVLLRAVADVIGSTVRRWQAEAQARQAHDELERCIYDRNNELMQRFDSEVAISRISTRLLTEEDFERSIQYTLADIGRITNSTHTILLRPVQDDHSLSKILQEWRRSGAPKLQDEQAQRFTQPDASLLQRLTSGEICVDELVQPFSQPLIPLSDNVAPLQTRTFFMMVPLKIERHLLGVLVCINHVNDSEEMEQHLQDIQVVGDMLTNLLHREDILETLEQRVADRTRELSTFYDMTMLVSSASNPKQILEPSLPRIMEAGQCDAVAVHLIASDHASLQLVAQCGLSAQAQDRMRTVLVSPGLTAWLTHFERPLLSSDASAAVEVPCELCVPGYQNYLGAQLRAGGEVLGILSCYRGKTGFALNQVSLLAALAEQLGVVIENHRLRHQAEETAIVTERHRLARELHDAVTQSIYSQTLFARAARNALEDGDTNRLKEGLSQLESSAADALREMRVLLYELRPTALVRGGLAQALSERLDLVERRVGIIADFRSDGAIKASQQKEEMLYRVAMEALNNSLKYAHATCVTLRLRARGQDIRVTIQDNGCGFNPGHTQTGMGITNMRERVNQCGGSFAIHSSPGQGTKVVVKVTADRDNQEVAYE